MNETPQVPIPGRGPSPTPSDRPSTAGPDAGAVSNPSRYDQLREMLALIESGDDPARVAELKEQFAATAQLQREVWSVLRKEYDLAALLSLVETRAGLAKRFEAALNRRDLTFPELLWLQRQIGKQLQALEQPLNQNPRPRKRRYH